LPPPGDERVGSVIRCPAGNNDADDRIAGVPSGREAILNFSGTAKIWSDREAI
jgi:hypothetical protein